MKRVILTIVAILVLLSGTAWAQSGKVDVLWLGQSAIKITSPSGKVIVIGPYLTRYPKTPEQYYLKPKYVLPFHYATNPFLVGTPQEYIKALGKTNTKVFPINPGEKLEF